MNQPVLVGNVKYVFLFMLLSWGGLSSRYYVTCVCLVGDLLRILSRDSSPWISPPFRRIFVASLFPSIILAKQLEDEQSYFCLCRLGIPPKPCCWNVSPDLGILSLQLFFSKKKSAWGNCSWLTPQRPPKVEQEKPPLNKLLRRRKPIGKMGWVVFQAHRLFGGLEDHPSWIQ